MHYVYILRSIRLERIYIGCTSNLKRRFGEHNRGKVRATEHGKPYELVYYEAYKDKRDAVKQERVLKTGQGRRILKRKLVYSR